MSLRRRLSHARWLAVAFTLASSPAAALTITGTPDNSYIYHEFRGSFLNYSDQTVVDTLQLPGNFGGTLNWSIDAALDQGTMRASASASSGEACQPGFCVVWNNEVSVVLAMADRVFIDQEITAPTEVTVRLAGNGVTSAPAGHSVTTTARLNAFTNPLLASTDEFISTEVGAIDFLLEDIITLLPGQQWFDLQMTLYLYLVSSSTTTGVFTEMDFGHTALLDIVLPDGLTFYSEGGFTGRSTAAIPEPATSSLVAAGLVGMALILRRRHLQRSAI